MPRPEDAPLILFFDLETTGSPEDSAIVEFGGVLVDRNMNVKGEREVVIRPKGWPHRQMDPFVVNMHETSGLMPLIEDGMTISEADEDVADWLRWHAKRAGMGSSHIPYAGSGVGHFDRGFIRRQMPLTSKRISYWPYDVSPLRRFYQWWGIDVPGLTSRDSSEAEHRALADAYDALGQAKAARDATLDAFAFVKEADA